MLDLRSAYNLVRIQAGNEWKTAFSPTLAVSEWPQLTSEKELQWVLGFANFHQEFLLLLQHRGNT